MPFPTAIILINLIHKLICSFTHSFNHSHPLTYTFYSHSLTFSLSSSFTHSITYTPTHFLPSYNLIFEYLCIIHKNKQSHINQAQYLNIPIQSIPHFVTSYLIAFGESRCMDEVQQKSPCPWKVAQSLKNLLLCTEHPRYT